MSGTTTLHALRYPGLGDGPNVPTDMQHLAEDVDALLSTFISVASAAARSALTAHVGMGIWRTDRLWAEICTGTGPAVWRIIGVVQVAAFGDLATYVTSPYSGQMAVVGGATVYTYDGSAWQLVTVAGGGFARKTADESVTSNTTVQNDDHLSLPVVANAVYELEMWVAYVSASETPDLKIGFTLPASATVSFSTLGLLPGITASTAGSIEAAAQLAQTTPTGTINLGAVAAATGMSVHGLVVVGATAGTFQFQWAQATSNGTATVVKKDSWLKLRRVA